MLGRLAGRLLTAIPSISDHFLISILPSSVDLLERSWLVSRQKTSLVPLHSWIEYRWHPLTPISSLPQMTMACQAANLNRRDSVVHEVGEAGM